MGDAFPFFSNHPDDAGNSIYHTHPRCRVAQRVVPEKRVDGTGENRVECPFCFLLAQFQANRGLRGHAGTAAPPVAAPTGGVGTAVRPQRAAMLR